MFSTSKPRLLAALTGCLVGVAGLAACSADVPEWAVVAPADPEGVPLYDHRGERVGTWTDADIVRLIPEGEDEPADRVEVLGGWVDPSDVNFCPPRAPNLRQSVIDRGMIEGLELNLGDDRVDLQFSLDTPFGEGFAGSYRCVDGEVWPARVDRGCGW